MFKASILPRKTKVISIMIISFLVIYMCLGQIFVAKSNAQSIENYSSRVSSYPGYSELIDNLKSKYPNWNFKILYTGLDWNQVIKNETTVVHGRNLVYSNKSGAWICSTCGGRAYDNGSWRCASEATVSYYMDPRNWMNEDYIFQFENLSFDSNTQNVDGVSKILANTPWAQGSSITYTRTDGSKATINKSYSQVIYEAARDANISAYHLAARIVQEQGNGNSPSATASGTYSGYNGHYNFCNIGATGNSSSAVIARALSYAQSCGWTDPETSIRKSAAYIARNYISIGQSTLYLQKYDVDSSDGSLYTHQYMQNVSAAVTESSSVKSSYSKLGILNSNFTFLIPVYENMPSSRCGSPDSASVMTQDVKVTGDEVSVRSSGSLLGGLITRVNTGDILLRIESASSTSNGYYWDKVVLPSGAKGYIARNYITPIVEQTNCNISAITNTDVNLRNGPGTVGTSVITTLIQGQNVTIVEKGKYNLNDYDWVRVKLSNGSQGYLASRYLNELGENQSTNNNNNSNSSSNYIVATINCDDGSYVRMRSEPTTSSSILTSLDKGTTVTVTQENVASANGFSWDKIVTTEGLEGYIANQYLNKQGNSNNNESNNSENNQPTANSNGEDTDGDGKVNSKDLYNVIVFLQNHMGEYTAEYDVNKDNKVNSQDLYRIIEYIQKH